MPKVFLHSEVKATWAGGMVDQQPDTSKDLARVSVRLLIEEVGTQAARRFLRRELARYKPDYEGNGKIEPKGPFK